MAKILVVDDDPHIRSVLCFALARDGFVTAEAADGAAALAAVAREAPDLILLDVLMPELDGTEVCRRLRRSSDVPVIFLSSRDEEVDRILGLELGGDDYVTKPFSPREVVARVRAVLRRRQAQPETPATAPLRQGALELHPDRLEALWQGRPVVLTVTEFALLHAMAAAPGRVFTRDRLMDLAYPDRRVVSDRTLDSHIRHIRAKFAALGAEPIGTVHGMGYRFLAGG
ncbi:response regulator transcription factor [Falsiroseomonas tokyonensis]|uniref:Response regulator n=1 Tax=Falsiroseomonas tokyonensis TaxID=430521 RepID=A0ABV7C0J0_9PROT|nr:response regulator transcription factor [Falsiroseomonas tokyonensis]MBU8540995.1 response regulator transcription factor [Falsiroseomonas tokyonensis]